MRLQRDERDGKEKQHNSGVDERGGEMVGGSGRRRKLLGRGA